MASPEMLASLPHDDQNRGPGFITCTAITNGAAFGLVTLRVYVRVAIVRNFGMDDYTVLLAMVLALM